MRTGSYIGYVGGLAAAVGVGAAVAISLGAPTASADDSAGNTSRQPHSSSTPARGDPTKNPSQSNKRAASRTTTTTGSLSAVAPPPTRTLSMQASTAISPAPPAHSNSPNDRSAADNPLVFGLLQLSHRPNKPTSLSPSPVPVSSTSQPLTTGGATPVAAVRAVPVPATAVPATAVPVLAAVTGSIAAHAPIGVTTSPNGTVYTLSSGSAGFFGIGAVAPTVSVVSASTGQVIRKTPVSSSAKAILSGDPATGSVYVLNSGSVTVLNAAGVVTKTIKDGSSPIDMAVSGSHLYVLNKGSTASSAAHRARLA